MREMLHTRPRLQIVGEAIYLLQCVWYAASKRIDMA
jgi:hypothetical protein